MDSYLDISDDAQLVDQPRMFGELKGCTFMQIDSYEACMMRKVLNIYTSTKNLFTGS
jgi:hypothetical protein